MKLTLFLYDSSICAFVQERSINHLLSWNWTKTVKALVDDTGIGKLKFQKKIHDCANI